jgi:hypothetical protein
MGESSTHQRAKHQASARVAVLRRALCSSIELIGMGP